MQKVLRENTWYFISYCDWREGVRSLGCGLVIIPGER